jgi:uncharacterized protein (TIGR03382 family)
MLRALSVLAVGAALALSTVHGADAYQIFFGQDLNGTDAPLATSPNATNARAAFLSNLTGVGTETFETHLPPTTAPLALAFPGAGTATLTGTGEIKGSLPGFTDGFGRYATSGLFFWRVDAEPNGSFVVVFDAPVAAFGFFGTDIGDFDGRLTLRLTKTDSTITDIDVPHGTGILQQTSILYFGLIADSAAEEIAKITFLATDTAGDELDTFGFDDFTIASRAQVCGADCPTTVPGPGSLALLVLGGLGLALRRRAAQAACDPDAPVV